MKEKEMQSKIEQLEREIAEMRKFERAFREERHSLFIEMQNTRRDLFDRIDAKKAEIENFANQLFENAEFIKMFKKEMFRAVSAEIRVKMDQDQFRQVVTSKIEDVFENNFRKVVDIVVDRLLNNLNKKLERDLTVTKDLTYSINSTIKSTLRGLPISAAGEEEVKDQINRVLQNRQLLQQTAEDKALLEFYGSKEVNEDGTRRTNNESAGDGEEDIRI